MALIDQTVKRSCLMVITGAFGFHGGIAVSNHLILYALRDLNYTIDILALNEAEDGLNAYPKLPIRSHQAFANKQAGFTLATWSKLLRYQYDVVFCDHIHLASILFPLKIKKRPRVIVRVHGAEVFPPYPTWRGKLGLRGVDCRLAVSKFTQQVVQNQFPNMKVDLCDHALDPERWPPPDIEAPKAKHYSIEFEAHDGVVRPLGNQVILIVGFLSSHTQYKGQDVLIESLAAVLVAHPDAQLVIVGVGSDSERLRQLASRQAAHVQKAIFCTGFVSDETLKQLYQHSYLFAMPSRGEGFGLVYLEAMRWAKPCVGSRQDAARSVIVHGQTGLLVEDATSVEEVGNTLKQLLGDPELARKMGLAGYKLLCNHYQYPSFRERFAKALESLEE